MGYTTSDKKEFLALHGITFACLAASAGFAFHLAPPDSRCHESIFVENTFYEELTNGDTGWRSAKLNIINNVNPVVLIAWVNVIASVSHGVAILMMLGKHSTSLQVYDGKSRPYEYIRRWITYSVTNGLLAFALLVAQGELNFLVLLTVLVGNVAIQLIHFYNDVHPRDKLSVIPSIVSFIILGGGIAIFGFKAANNASVVTTGGTTSSAKAHQYDLLTILFTVFYAATSIHQLLVITSNYYAKKWDMDRIYIVLDLTSKIVLTWTSISITRASADELGKPFDGKVGFEDNDNGDVESMLHYWAWIRWGLLIATGAVWIIMWGCDGPVNPRNKQVQALAREQTNLLVKPPGDDDEGSDEEEDPDTVKYMPSRVGRRRRVGLNF